MKNKTLVTIILSIVVLTLISGAVFIRIVHASGSSKESSALASEGSRNNSKDDEDQSDYTYIPPTPADHSTTEDISSFESEKQEEEVEAFIPATEINLEPTSITVFVNKEHALPKAYKPDKLVTPKVKFKLITYDERTLMRPEAAIALERLFEAAEQDDIILYGISAYRSYKRQSGIFRDNIIKKGKTYTLRYSAAPGTSEHQTGLAIDVSAKSQDFKLSNTFASTTEGKWLAENAHQYGYIIRYPDGNEDITGYAYEPWHIRYVGIDLAKYLYTNHLTLEEYYHYTPSPDFDFEAKYAKLINYTPPKVTTAPVSGAGITGGENGEDIDGDLVDALPKEDGKDESKGGKDKPGKPKEDAPKEDPSDIEDEVDNPEAAEDDATEDNPEDTPDPSPVPSPSPSPSVTPAVPSTEEPTVAPSPTPDPSVALGPSVAPSNNTSNE